MQDAGAISYLPEQRALMIRHNWFVQEEVYARLEELRLAHAALQKDAPSGPSLQSQQLLEILKKSGAAPVPFPGKTPPKKVESAPMR